MPARAEVEEALRTIVDPCSAMSGVPVNIVEMGIVRTIEVESEDVKVELQLTDGTCYFSFHLARLTQEAVEALPGVGEVVVELVAKELWTPEKIAPEARRRLAEARARRLDATKVEPWARRSRSKACGVEHGERV